MIHEIGNQVSTIVIDGQEFSLSKLTVGDFCAACQFLSDRAVNRLIEATRDPRVEPDERAAAIAKVAAEPATLRMALDDWEANARLLMYSMSRATGRPVSFEEIKALALPTRGTLFNRLLELSGAARRTGDDESDPTRGPGTTAGGQTRWPDSVEPTAACPATSSP